MLAGFVGQWRAAEVGCQCHSPGSIAAAATLPKVVAVILRQAEAPRSEARTGCIVPSVSAALHAESCLRQAAPAARQ